MNLNQLKVFHAVAKLRSFTLASEALFITQPGVSKHVKKLEDHLGVNLFDRLGKEIVPTQAGEILYASTQAVFRLIDDAKVRIEDLKMLTGGRITIGASFTPGTYIVPEIIGQFNARYPDVKIVLTIDSSNQIARNVLANELDLGLVGAPHASEKLIFEDLCDDALVVIMPRDHRWKNRRSIRIKELVDQPFINSMEGSGTRTAIETQLGSMGVKTKKKIAIGNTEAVKKAVAAGIGISIISEAAIRDEVASGQIRTIPLSDCQLKRTFYYAYRKDKYQTHATKALINLCNAMNPESASGSLKPANLSR